jgi:putative NADH-flavin reductase
MRVVLIGATGFVGSRILSEALNRGHEVTAIVRNPEKLPQHPRLKAARCDVFDEEAVAVIVARHDAVISAFNPSRVSRDDNTPQIGGIRSLITGMKKARVKRLLVVGGAGSLEIAPGLQLVDTLDFPPLWKAGALATREVLNILRSEQELEWCFLSPSAVLEPGQRTGHFRLGTDQLLKDSAGQSRISLEDYAVAMIDELENPRHIRRRFTVGY